LAFPSYDARLPDNPRRPTKKFQKFVRHYAIEIGKYPDGVTPPRKNFARRILTEGYL
jgi:hypothetical protein